MSAKDNGYDNACAESFFHSLKVEVIHGERFITREALRQTVFEYIETDTTTGFGYTLPITIGVR